MTGSGREAPMVVGRPARMSESERDASRWSGGPPGCPGVVGRPSCMSDTGREALPDVRVWSGIPPG